MGTVTMAAIASPAGPPAPAAATPMNSMYMANGMSFTVLPERAASFRVSFSMVPLLWTMESMGILTILFNRQIVRYLGNNALAVYGVIVQISTFAQCCAYSIGQASQPIISVNLGAGKGERIRQLLKYALGTMAFFGVLWTALSLAVPNLFIRVFMTPTPEVLQIAPNIFRRYGLAFLILPLNIYSTYYFQALLKPRAAFIVSVARGFVISGILIYLLPVMLGSDAIWFSMPITEVIVAVYVVYQMRKYTKNLEGKEVYDYE